MLQAAELLRNPLLQPYVINTHLKLNIPRRNSLPGCLPDNDVKKTRFAVSESTPFPKNRDKRMSCGNDRTLNPSVSDHDCTFSNHRHPKTPSRASDLSVGSPDIGSIVTKKITSKASLVNKNPKVIVPKLTTPRRQVELRNNDLVRLQVEGYSFYFFLFYKT